LPGRVQSGDGGLVSAIGLIKKGGALSDGSTSQRAIQVEHVTMRSPKAFSEVTASLERLVPKLDEKISQFIASGEVERLKQALEEGPELSIFLCRDHGSLLKVAGRAGRAVQYEIGNPLTASKMTRHRLAAGLYAPLRAIL